MTADITAKTVLITGAAERAGRVFARRFAAEGANVVVNHWRQADLAEETVALIHADGGRARAIEADVSDTEAARRLVAETVAWRGDLSVLIHNASSLRSKEFEDVTEEDFDASFGINIRGPFFLSQAAAEVMKRQGHGRIIALVGNSTNEAWPNLIPHGLSKTALIRLMEQLAVALSPTVQCNAVAPTQFFRSDDGTNDALREYRGEPLVDGDTYRVGSRYEFRNGDADDVAETLLFLATCSSYLNGTVIRLDGGKALY
ncbi:SDR family NAD(P)-dependent oxidoreductase [Nocardioides nitrophenolicus]|uniref:SDR family NAD(P)-dependent oxidoreductase n=1 Tax=Nocardioides nitrophenolicus TaxID=60489 RepID=UPI0019585D96|nr:SDR family oxidoreductase [Nocardioides nitrophenolicus]MBM7518567.1 NAD(P)-dependent dehydrogenase (short-subunit alcohol dehydrogenase family) [Nocardioides nitrophenolicus]